MAQLNLPQSHRATEKDRQGDKETRRQGAKETGRQGDKEKVRRRENSPCLLVSLSPCLCGGCYFPLRFDFDLSSAIFESFFHRFFSMRCASWSWRRARCSSSRRIFR